MTKAGRTKLLIIGLYLLCFFFYILMLQYTYNKMERWYEALDRLKIEYPVDLDSFTFLHIHLCYFILSTYNLLKYLNVPIMNKVPEIIINIIAFSFVLIGAFKYYQVKYYSLMITVTGLLFYTIRKADERISKA